PLGHFHGHFRRGESIFTAHCANVDFLCSIPSPEHAPGPHHKSMDGDYRHISWISPHMLYLLFLPCQNPFHGPLFARLDVSGHPQAQPPTKTMRIGMEGSKRFAMKRPLAKSWSELENAMRAVLRAMLQQLPDFPYKGMLSVPYPSQFGFGSAYGNIPTATAAIRNSRDAFLPLMAKIAMMFLLLDNHFGNNLWRERVIETSEVHPQWFADLEHSAAGDMGIERTGVDLHNGKHPLNALLKAIVGKLHLPLYFHWGPLNIGSCFSIPYALAAKEFFPSEPTIHYLCSILGEFCSTPWKELDMKEGSEKDCSTNPTASGADMTPPMGTAPDSVAGFVFPPSKRLSDEETGEDIHAFLALRQAKQAKWAATETSENRNQRLAREAQASDGGPPKNNDARVFVWETASTGHLVRRNIGQDAASEIWNDFTLSQRRYDSWTNEWDLCLALDSKAPLGTGHDGMAVPPVTSTHSYLSLDDIPNNSPEYRSDDENLRMQTSSDIPEAIQDTSPAYGLLRPPAANVPGDGMQISSSETPPLLPEEPIGPHSSEADLQSAYTAYSFAASYSETGLKQVKHRNLDMVDVLYSRFGFVPCIEPSSPMLYKETLRPDFCSRSVGDEKWAVHQDPKFALLPVLLAFLCKAKSLEDVPRELIDLRQDLADMACNSGAVQVKQEVLNQRVFFVVRPATLNADLPNSHVLLESAATTLEIIRMGWGSSNVDEIATRLRQRGIQHRVCTLGPLRRQPTPPLFHTGLGLRPVGYRPTWLDYQAYKTRRQQFINSPRGRIALSAGGIVTRLAITDNQHLGDDCGPVSDLLTTGMRFWDGESNVAYWGDGLTAEEVDLICGVYVVATGWKSAAESDGLQKKSISWWPTPAAFFTSGMNIGWWSPDCERWYQKRVREIETNVKTTELFTANQWKNKIRFKQKSREVALANEKVSAQYLSHVLAR
ncbi:hypothetical protein R3P38DRAFT_2531002, partial [Favolaschia claudopus]